MNIKKSLLRWSVTVLAVLMLAACGSSTTSSPTTGNASVQKAETGQVTFSVQFPQADLGAALMENRTVAINVQWFAFDNPSENGSVTLTPDASGLATATVNVPVGDMHFKAIAQDSNFMALDSASNAGEITAGSNQIVNLTFLGGDWQFVDADDNPLPQSFAATTLAGFSLFSLKSDLANGAAAKATVDTAKSQAVSEYLLQWQNNTPAAIVPLTHAAHWTQFSTPAATGSALGSEWLNITDPTRRSDFYGGVDLNPVQGDRLVRIINGIGGIDMSFGLPKTTTDANNIDLTPQIRALGDTQVIDGNHLGGHLMAMTFESQSRAVTGTNVDCYAFWYGMPVTPAAARAAAIKASLTRAAGKAAIGAETTLAETATVKYAECLVDGLKIDYDGDGDLTTEELTSDLNGNLHYDAGDAFIDSDLDGQWDYTYYPGTTYSITEHYSNIAVREFRAKGSQAGSLFIPVAPTVTATSSLGSQ
jgi:hypothetical protein